MSHPVDVATSTLASQTRLWRGTASFRPARKQPEQPLELFDLESSPYCRLVREVLTELDLDVMIYPCPSKGQRFRQKIMSLGGKYVRPFLVDPNTGRSMYESADIIEYLATTYDGRTRGTRGVARGVAVGTAYLASGVRALSGGLRGHHARPSREPARPLELYSFESSPFSRIVREALCELEIPYLLRQFGKAQWGDMGPPWVRATFFSGNSVEGRNRRRMFEQTGRMQVPYLIDPNTDTAMFESARIVRYLEKTYGA